ncbi:MAG: hypothetical protein PQJ46_05130 [Spirochaetales bacterium]|nr:hypothetical protein [Spirochaetales bacterium]
MKKIPVILILILLFTMFLSPLSAQQNPFLSSGNETASPQKSLPPSAKTTKASNAYYNSKFMQNVKAKQKKLQDKISNYITDYKTDKTHKKLFTFMAFSFLYGLLHVLGPGHRKIALFSYFISKPAKWKNGMFAGFMTAVLHAFSAILFILTLYAITKTALMRRFNDITPIMEKISYGMIVAIGIYIIISYVYELIKKNAHDNNGRNPDTILFVIASGMVPCPGAATIMIFSIAVNVPLLGIYAVAAMSLGMASVLTFIPLLAIFLRTRINPAEKWNQRTGEIIHTAISCFGAILLILFGLFFLI